MKLLRILAVASISAVMLMGQAVAAFAHPQHEPTAVSMTSPARSATAKYHSLTVAKKAGYSILADTAGITCIADPQMGGAMGVHYVKSDLVKDPAIAATEPEALVYAPDRHGRLRLAALEYVVIKANWDANQVPPASYVGSRDAQAPPMLFGHTFNFTDAPNRYGLPPFYSLHAWIWKQNPAGTFQMWNPSVHCAT
ncbi:MAG TPA: hypothetical protein VNC13_03115 [Propionibacteriaceae bacterium]|jgi:hypothetical protein|nr:hypothetical protein [Propionibacteriaceae bacterium]